MDSEESLDSSTIGTPEVIPIEADIKVKNILEINVNNKKSKIQISVQQQSQQQSSLFFQYWF